MAETIELAGGGRLCLTEDGAFVRCEATRPNDGRGIYKVWLQGRGNDFLLGTLIPEGDGLRLCRRVSRDSLERADCWPVKSGRCVLALSFLRKGWVREAVEPRMSDSILRRAARGLSALVREDGDGFAIALPFDTARPFALAPVFCFARMERVEGRLCAVFRFDAQGRPQMQD